MRPDFAEGGARLDSLSYPSGHSSGIATLVTVALVLAWPLLAARARHWALAAGVVLVLLVGLTRMWLGVHFLSDVVGGWALGRGLDPADRAAVRGVRRGPGGPAADVVTGLDQRIVLAPDRRLARPAAADRRRPARARARGTAGTSTGPSTSSPSSSPASLRHGWARRRRARPPGTSPCCGPARGWTHDEVAGDDGARVLQCYLRSADPGAPPAHEVHRAASGWVDLGRPDARLWLARVAAGGGVDVPAGLLVVRGADGVLVEQQAGRAVTGPGAVLVWQLDTARGPPGRTA